MANLLTFSGVATKIRAMEAHLLTQKNFEEIANLSNVTEVVTYLKQVPAYRDVFANVDENTLHRGDVEKLLTQSLYADYSRLYSFSGLEVRKFLKLYLKRYEVDLINYCSRIVYNHYQQPFDLQHKKAFFDKFSQLSIDKLMEARSMTELTEALRSTEYYKPLQKLSECENPTMFDYDLALDLYYFSSIWKERKKILKKADFDMFTRTIGAKADLLNLQWIYRAKKYYHLQPASIYSMLIPISYHLKQSTIQKLIEASSLEEFLAIAGETYYVKKYGFQEQYTMEHLYKDCLYHLYMAEKRKSPYSLATIHSYLFLKEEEIKKLTTTLECIRYGLSPAETFEFTGGVSNR